MQEQSTTDYIQRLHPGKCHLHENMSKKTRIIEDRTMDYIPVRAGIYFRRVNWIRKNKSEFLASHLYLFNLDFAYNPTDSHHQTQ